MFINNHFFLIRGDNLQADIKRDILQIIDNAIEILRIIEEKDLIELKELSNHTIHNASIYQDKDSITIAVTIYALSKIIERNDAKVWPSIFYRLNAARKYLWQNQDDKYRKEIENLLKDIAKVDSRLKLYAETVIDQAKIKKGGKLFEHGLSMGKASELLGISQWELQSYIGNTKLVDAEAMKTNVLERLRFARGLFQ